MSIAESPRARHEMEDGESVNTIKSEVLVERFDAVMKGMSNIVFGSTNRESNLVYFVNPTLLWSTNWSWIETEFTESVVTIKYKANKLLLENKPVLQDGAVGMRVVDCEDELIVLVLPVTRLPPLPLSDVRMQPTKVFTPLMSNMCVETTIILRLRLSARKLSADNSRAPNLRLRHASLKGLRL